MENQLPVFREENGNDSGTAMSNDFGNDGAQNTPPEQQEDNKEEKALWNVELGGAKMSSWAILKM